MDREKKAKEIFNFIGKLTYKEYYKLWNERNKTNIEARAFDWDEQREEVKLAWLFVSDLIESEKKNARKEERDKIADELLKTADSLPYKTLAKVKKRSNK